MEMQHTFSVPVPIDAAWKAMTDPERVAPCMPGATLTKAEGNEFAGSVKVKLGPVTLLYKGTGVFKDIDEENRRLVIDASGKDSRGSGTAAATVVVTLTDEGDTTSGKVDTDLKVTGKPAQLGRGLISEVGGKILNQFADNLAKKLESEQEAPPAQEKASAEPQSTETKGGTNGDGAAAAAGSAAAGPAVGSARKDTSWRVTPASADSPSPTTVADPAANDEAIDLLGTAGTPVLKRAAPAVIGLLVAFIVLRRFKKRRARKRAS
ncbi:carbon monoxide dehydrogenase [Saccharopolyspora aridisoli]|uniref:Carbon monoxide dehydrogenase n=1 Tax=Saccharopolyspora aridisoli TaxID=2530385 RepID=A0A4R4UL57_9PSEU|nr:SRPBCC family protein [Saccharopolyspora aridisoli]TDC92380.1 carbon monoxide dehydrogenase [Saccharopolyspora aridisoli]